MSWILGVVGALTLAGAQAETPCTPMMLESEALTSWKDNGFPVENETQADSAIRGLVSCLASTDPEIRDGIGYTGLAAVLRDGKTTEEARHEVMAALFALTKAPDPEGVAVPFAVLGLSEIARTDRIESWMTDQERDRLVNFATDYLENVDDYRGFTDGEGWRHGIAHGADLLLQLTLNNEVRPEQLQAIADAILIKAAPREHAYIHGETGRLVRPLLFIAQRGALTEDDWANWYGALVLPGPMVNWGYAFKSEEGLAQLHNTRLFALETLARTGGENTPPALMPLHKGAKMMLEILP